MGATKKWRADLLRDERETENYPPFDHYGNFCKKVKENWLTTEKLTLLKQSTNVIELTNALISYKMDEKDKEIIMSWIDKLEPKYIKGSEYIVKVCESPLDNMKRVYQKYTEGMEYGMRRDAKIILETEILKKQRNENK